MQFKRLFIKNFMSVGEPGIEIDFTALKGPVLILGRNLDVGEGSSNGAGKSLPIEAILWALYGKTLRGLSKNEVINNVNLKRTEIVLEVDDLKIQRMRKPNKLRLYEDANHEFPEDTEISLSKVPKTEELIAEKIGVDYTTFCNIFIFGQHNQFSFISADEKTRREIVEDLLSLSEYNLSLEETRSALRTMKSSLRELLGKLEIHLQHLGEHRGTHKSYSHSQKEARGKIEVELSRLKDQFKALERLDPELELKEWSLYDRAQVEVPKTRAEISRIDGESSLKQNRAQNTRVEIKRIQAEIDKLRKLEPGVSCDKCFSTIDPENAKPFIEERLGKRGKLEREAEKALEGLPDLQEEKKKATALLRELRTLTQPTRTREFLQGIQTQIEKIKALMGQKMDQLDEDPYGPLIKEVEKKISKCQVLVSDLKDAAQRKEGIIPYLEFWVQGFGPEGIRSFIVENVIGFLNNQINYWLQFLIDNKIIVLFDKFLEVEIRRTSKEGFSYKQGSGGEKKRIDLAISLAFADLMRISNNTHNNIMFLDEVVDSLDFSGVSGIYNLIMELAKTKTVFIITHNPDLLAQLEGVSKIKIKKQDGFSSIENMEIRRWDSEG